MTALSLYFLEKECLLRVHDGLAVGCEKERTLTHGHLGSVQDGAEMESTLAPALLLTSLIFLVSQQEN